MARKRAPKPLTVSVRELAHGYPAILDDLSATGESKIVTRHNVPVALLTAIDDEKLLALQSEMLLRSPRFVASTKAADDDIAAHRTISGDEAFSGLLGEPPPEVESRKPSMAFSSAGGLIEANATSLIEAIRAVVKSELSQVRWSRRMPLVFSRNRDLVAHFELPGINPEDELTLTYSTGRLTVSAQSGIEGGNDDLPFSFVDVWRLPTAVDESTIRAEYHDPILEIVVEGAAALADKADTSATQVPVQKAESG